MLALFTSIAASGNRTNVSTAPPTTPDLVFDTKHDFAKHLIDTNAKLFEVEVAGIFRMKTIEMYQSENNVKVEGEIRLKGALVEISRDVNRKGEEVLGVVQTLSETVPVSIRPLDNNKDSVLQAVAEDGMALQNASKQLRNDLDVVQVAITQNPEAVQYAGDDAKQLITEILKENGIDLNASTANNLVKSLDLEKTADSSDAQTKSEKTKEASTPEMSMER